MENHKSLPVLDRDIFPTYAKLGCKFAHRRPLLMSWVVRLFLTVRICSLLFIIPLLSNLLVLLSPPIQCKGGMLMELFKDKGVDDDR